MWIMQLLDASVKKLQGKATLTSIFNSVLGSVKIGFVYSAPSAGAREDWKMAHKIKGAAAFE
jgi:hypothetical protein